MAFTGRRTSYGPVGIRLGDTLRSERGVMTDAGAHQGRLLVRQLAGRGFAAYGAGGRFFASGTRSVRAAGPAAAFQRDNTPTVAE